MNCESCKFKEAGMDYKELIEWLRHTVGHGDEDPREYCTNRCGGCEMCDQAATAIETLLTERDAAVAGLIGDCSRCVYIATPLRDSPCNDCRYNYLNGNPLRGKVRWRWRGPQKEGDGDG